MATVAASVALGLADLPRKEAESGSSKLQPFGVVGDELSLLRASTNDPVSMAVAKILEASVLSRSMEEDSSGSGGMATGSRRGCKRKNPTQRGPAGLTVPLPYETGLVSPQFPATAADAAKRQRVVTPMINSQLISANKQAQFVVNLPAAIPLSQLGSRISPAMAVRQMIVSSPSVSQANTALLPSVAYNTSGTNTAMLTAMAASTPAMLVSLYPAPISTTTSLSSTTTLPSVSVIHPVSTALQQSTVSSVRSLLQQISSSSVSSPVVTPVSAVVNQPSHTAPSSQALAAATSLLSLPSHVPLTSSQNIAVSQQNQTVSSGTTVSIVPAAAQLVSGSQAAVTVVNQQSLKTLGNVYIVNSHDGQPGRAILLQHRAMPTIPTAFSLIPVSTAHTAPSDSPQPHTLDCEVAAESPASVQIPVSSVPQTVNLPITSDGHMAVTCSQSVSFNAKPIVSTSTCISTSATSQMDSMSDEMVTDSMAGESPDSEVTRAAEELVRLQAGGVTSSENTAALLLNNPSLLEATTTLLSLQTSTVLPADRKVNKGDRNGKDEGEVVAGREKTDGQGVIVVNGKENTESNRLKVTHSSVKDMTSRENEEKIGDSDERKGVIPTRTVPGGYPKDLKTAEHEIPNNSIDKAVPEVFADEGTRPSVEAKNDAGGKENENNLVDKSNTELSVDVRKSATMETLPAMLSRERVGQQNQPVSKEPVNKQATPSGLFPKVQAPKVSKSSLVSTTTNISRLDTLKTSQSVLSDLTAGLPRQPSFSSMQTVAQQTPPLVTSQALQPTVPVPAVYPSHPPMDLRPVAACDGHGNRFQSIYLHPPSPPVGQHQGGSVPNTPCSNSSTLLLSPPGHRPNTIPIPFSATPTMPLQSTLSPIASQSHLTRGDAHLQQDLSVSPSSSLAQTTAIHLRIQGSTVTTRLPTSTSPLEASRTSSPAASVSGSPQEVAFKTVALPTSASPSQSVSVSSQPTFSVAHSSVLDVLGDVTVSQSQDEADSDQLKSIIEDLGVNLDDPESFLVGDHLSFESSLDPDILSDVFAAISAADMTLSRASPPILSSVPPLTNELATLRNFPVPTYEQPHSYSPQAYRDKSREGTGRGKRTGHVERSISYSYPPPRPANVITTRRSSAAVSLTDDGDGEDGLGIRQSKRKRRLTAIMTDDPYPAPKTETISVPSWVKAAIA